MSQSTRNRAARVSEFITQQIESGKAPGIQYRVLNADSALFSYAGGLADIAGGRPVDESTTMMIYSMSKTITAAAVLQLVEKGTISLDDPITKYLNDIPYGEEVRVRHLLAQSSGIPNPIPLRWVHLAGEHAGFDEEAALRKVLDDNRELNFRPGEKYAYSNISYWLLGRLIEKVTGTRYAEYVRENIFRRLRIPESEIDVEIPSPHHHAKGYLPKWSFMNLFKSFLIDEKFFGDYEDGWLHIYDHYLNGPAFGGIVGSARAIGMFLQDQLRDSSMLFESRTKAVFYEQQRTNEGELTEMTPGWHIGERDGVAYYFKEGGGGGFHCEMRIYPSRRIASVVIANNTSFDAKGFLNVADREFILR